MPGRRSGTLTLDWSQAAATTNSGEITFDLRLPASGRRQLEITAPINVELTVDSGLIEAGEASAREPKQRMWRLSLSGDPLTKLHVRTIQSSPDSGPLVAVREATNYSVLGSEIDLETTWSLDVLQQPIKLLEVQVDPALQITAVRLARKVCPFRSLRQVPIVRPS